MNYLLAVVSTGLFLLMFPPPASAQYRGGYHGGYGYHGGPAVRVGFGFGPFYGSPYYGYYPPAYYVAPAVEVIQVPVVQTVPVYTQATPAGQAMQNPVVRQASATVPPAPPPSTPIVPAELIYIDGHYQFKR